MSTADTTGSMAEARAAIEAMSPDQVRALYRQVIATEADQDRAARHVARSGGDIEARAALTGQYLAALDKAHKAFARLHKRGVGLKSCTTSPEDFATARRRIHDLMAWCKEELRAAGESDGAALAAVDPRQTTMALGGGQ